MSDADWSLFAPLAAGLRPDRASRDKRLKQAAFRWKRGFVLVAPIRYGAGLRQPDLRLGPANSEYFHHPYQIG
jgi:hypothetical protein